MDEIQLAEFRNRQIGFVFQAHICFRSVQSSKTFSCRRWRAGTQRCERKRRRERSGCWNASGWALVSDIGQASFPAANDSAWPWCGR
jgi:hypothetical protein